MLGIINFRTTTDTQLWKSYRSPNTTMAPIGHTSPILTGVPIRVGMQGRGQRSRHSGWETTRQSRHFRDSLPNFIRFPHGTQDSGLITWGRDGAEGTEWYERENGQHHQPAFIKHLACAEQLPILLYIFASVILTIIPWNRFWFL